MTHNRSEMEQSLLCLCLHENGVPKVSVTTYTNIVNLCLF